MQVRRFGPSKNTQELLETSYFRRAEKAKTVFPIRLDNRPIHKRWNSNVFKTPIFLPPLSNAKTPLPVIELSLAKKNKIRLLISGMQSGVNHSSLSAPQSPRVHVARIPQVKFEV